MNTFLYFHIIYNSKQIKSSKYAIFMVLKNEKSSFFFLINFSFFLKTRGFRNFSAFKNL